MSQTLGEDTVIVLIFCWYAKEKWGSYFSLVACEDCLDVCFKRLVIGMKYVWYLLIVVTFMGFGQAGGVIIWGWRCKSQKGRLFS